MGDGRYGVVLANYGLAFNLYEVSATTGTLQNVAADVGIPQTAVGGRALVAGPLHSDFGMDIFANNENAVNWLMKNDGTGSFTNIAAAAGLEDGRENGRGTVIFDANDDGLLDLVYGNWNGEHRLYLQDCDGEFRDVATPEMSVPSPIRTVIAADFDNDGYQDIFFNNIPGSNRLFSRAADGESWVQVDIGDAVDVAGRGTGAGVGDLDGDGRLELLVSHGESASQPLSLYVSRLGLSNAFIRVRPLTRQGAPARGATVRLHHISGRKQLQIIDAGSGYLCQQEPVAHFGLGDNSDAAVRAVVRWPNGDIVTLTAIAANTTIRISPPDASGVVSASAVNIDGAAASCDAASTPELGAIRGTVCDNVNDQSSTPSTCVTSNVPGTPSDLRNAYYDIFKTSNRNAASHLWSAYVLDRACAMDFDTAMTLFASFCPVSGSPVTPSPQKTYSMMLPQVGSTGQNVEGFINFCCKPCVCDSNDFIKVDSRTYNFKDGPRSLNVLVIGDPCINEAALSATFVDPFDGREREIRSAAPELKCDPKTGKLVGAHYSDGGKVIIGVMRDIDREEPHTMDNGPSARAYCEARAEQGYNSGMGLIFRLVASIAEKHETVVSEPGSSKGTSDHSLSLTMLPTAVPSLTPSAAPAFNPNAQTTQTPSASNAAMPSSVDNVVTSVPSLTSSAAPAFGPNAQTTQTPSASNTAMPSSVDNVVTSTAGTSAVTTLPSQSPTIAPLTPTSSFDFLPIPTLGPSLGPSSLPDAIYPNVFAENLTNSVSAASDGSHKGIWREYHRICVFNMVFCVLVLLM